MQSGGISDHQSELLLRMSEQDAAISLGRRVVVGSDGIIVYIDEKAISPQIREFRTRQMILSALLQFNYARYFLEKGIGRCISVTGSMGQGKSTSLALASHALFCAGYEVHIVSDDVEFNRYPPFGVLSSGLGIAFPNGDCVPHLVIREGVELQDILDSIKPKSVIFAVETLFAFHEGWMEAIINRVREVGSVIFVDNLFRFASGVIPPNVAIALEMSDNVTLGASTDAFSPNQLAAGCIFFWSDHRNGGLARTAIPDPSESIKANVKASVLESCPQPPGYKPGDHMGEMLLWTTTLERLVFIAKHFGFNASAVIAQYARSNETYAKLMRNGAIFLPQLLGLDPVDYADFMPIINGAGM